MSHFTTHHIFGQQVLKGVSAESRRLIALNRAAFCWGLQGADLLYTHRHVNEYSSLPLYGRLIHGEKTNSLFTFLAQDLLNHRKCLDFDTLMAYYSGFCCHYALDSALHPYVFAKQKVLEESPQSSLIPVSAHWYIEDGIDHELSAHLDSVNGPVEDCYKTDRALRRTVAALYSRVLWGVYELKVRSGDIEECFIEDHFRTDMIYRPDGFVKGYAAMDDAFLSRLADLKTLFADASPTADDCLNLRKQPWRHHGEGRDYDLSVVEIMANARETALTLISRSNAAIRQGNRHMISNMDFSRSFVDGKFR